jgi:hypothetical protein
MQRGRAQLTERRGPGIGTSSGTGPGDKRPSGIEPEADDLSEEQEERIVKRKEKLPLRGRSHATCGRKYQYEFCV